MPARELSLTEKQQMRDELYRARLMAKHMDQVIAALDPAKPVTLYEIDVMCPKCGAREIYQTRDPKAPATAALVCRRCTDVGL